MIGKGSKKNKKRFRNIVFSAVLVSVFASSVIIAPKQALAFENNMDIIFPASGSGSEVGSGLPSTISTTGGAYNGIDGQDKYVVSNANLKVDLDTSKISSGNTFTAANNAFFKIRIKMGGAPEDIKGLTDRNSNQIIDNDDELGSWGALYDSQFQYPASSGPRPMSITYLGDNLGMWLEIGTNVIPGEPETDIGTDYTLFGFIPTSTEYGAPPIMPQITGGEGLLSGGRIRLDPVINFIFTEQTIPLTIGSDIDLQPNTQYYARIFLEEEALSNVASSNIVSFRTGSDTSTEIGGGIGETDGQQATGSTENAGDILELAPCNITPGTWFTGCLVHLFYYALYVPSHWLVQGAGWLLDISITFAISTKIYTDPTFITSGWRVIRDVSNIFFIFVLIFAAVKMILGDSLTNTKEMIAKIILVAVLINFSLFFTKVVVDSSNILARIFYRQIQITGTTPDPITDVSVTGVEEKSLSQALGDGFNIQKMMSDETVTRMNQSGHASESGWVFIIVLLAAIVNFVAAWTFFVCALLFIGRIVGLWVTMIFSAFAFMSTIFPEKLSVIPMVSWKPWFEGLLSMSFLAPIFLFFVYLIISFINSGFLDGLFLNIDNFAFTEFLIAIILQFAILITLIKQSKKMAMKMAGDLGGSIVSSLKGAGAAVGGFVTGAAVAVATGGVGAIGRATVGRAGAALSESQTLRAAEAKGGVRGWLANKTLKGSEYLGKSSYDVRGTKRFQSTMGSGKDLLGYDIKSGKAQEGGYKGAKEKEQKDRLDRFEKLKETRSPDQLKFTNADNRTKRDQYNKEMEQFRSQRDKDYNTFAQGKRGQPGFNEMQAQKDFLQNYNNANNPKPAPPTYKTVTADEINKQRRDDYEKQLRTGTIGAAVQSVTGIKTGTRAGELAAADALRGNPKDIEKADANIKKYKAASDQLTNEIKNLTKKMEDRDKKFNPNNNLSRGDIEKAINKQMATVQAEAETNKVRLETMTKEIAEMPPGSVTPMMKGRLAVLQLNKNKHEAELNDLKNAFKFEDARAQKEDTLEKYGDKIKKESQKLPGAKPEEKK